MARRMKFASLLPWMSMLSQLSLHAILVTKLLSQLGWIIPSGQAVVIIDSDLQDPPEVILDMIAKWKDGFEVVYAQRSEREGETWFKLFTASLFYRLIYRITDVNIPMDTGDFRLARSKSGGCHGADAGTASILARHVFLGGFQANGCYI